MHNSMNIFKRERGHIRDTESGRQLIADAVGQTPQFPPADFYLDAVPSEILLPRTGTLYTYTVVHDAKGGRYGLAMVDFDGGVRVFGRLLNTDVAACELGATVGVVPYQLHDGAEDYAFEVLGQRHD